MLYKWFYPDTPSVTPTLPLSPKTPDPVPTIQTALSNLDTSVTTGFDQMCDKLEASFFPTYEKHEKIFDYRRLYSRMHIARAFLFTELISRIAILQNRNFNLDHVRLGISGSQLGRTGAGINLWMEDSRQAVAGYLRRNGERSGIVEGSLEYSLILNGSRLDTRHRVDFSSPEEGFLGNTALEQQVLRETTQFFKESEAARFQDRFSNNSWFMRELLMILRNSPEKYPLLGTLLIGAKAAALDFSSERKWYCDR